MILWVYVHEEKFSNSLFDHVESYCDLLRSKTRFYTEQSYQYICGLFQSEKRNIEKMSEQVPDTNLQQLHHFISESPWDWQPLLGQLSRDVYAEFLTRKAPIGLLIDESGWKKQGDHSVGVARQYLGRLGKLDNGQVAVVGSLCQGDEGLLIDMGLYLPQSWIDDPARCDQAGIPAADQVFKTKPVLAQDLVARAWNRGLEVDWVGGDGAYGHDTRFRRWLDDRGQFYVLDIHQDLQIYLEDPQPVVPEPLPGKGRPPSRLKAQTDSISVKQMADQHPWKDWKQYTFRKGSKGPLKRKVWTRQIYTWDGQEKQARAETLIISCEPDGTNRKYSLANHQLAQLPEKELLYRQMQRFWVEQSIKDAKSELGMHQYQVRTWRAWHHHMALTCLALWFMLKIKRNYREELPLLSCNDIRFLLIQALPKKATSEQIAWLIIQERHKRRQADIDRFNNRS